MKSLVLSFLFILFLAMAGCAKAPISTPAPSTESPPPHSTRTATLPGINILPVISTSTTVPSITASPSPSPAMEYGVIKIFTQGHLPRFRYFVAMKFPQKVEGNFHAIVDSNKEYRCEVLVEYPDRLYCSGPLVGILIYTNIDLYTTGRNSPIFSTEIYIPDFGQ